MSEVAPECDGPSDPPPRVQGPCGSLGSFRAQDQCGCLERPDASARPGPISGNERLAFSCSAWLRVRGQVWSATDWVRQDLGVAASGRSGKEIIRCLRRYIARDVHAALIADFVALSTT